jgi:hypothetical protein
VGLRIFCQKRGDVTCVTGLRALGPFHLDGNDFVVKLEDEVDFGAIARSEMMEPTAPRVANEDSGHPSIAKNRLTIS